MGGVFDFAVLAIGRADEADRITAVALNFEMKGKRFAFNGHQMSILTSKNQTNNTKCMATNEMPNGCGSSIEAVLASNQKRRRVKDMACRSMLLKLEQKGLICLPARQKPSNNGCPFRPVAPTALPLVEPIECQLQRLEPLSILPAQSPEELALFDWLLWRYHYLPYNGAGGENIKYLAFDGQARPLACLLYGAAAWKLAVRDQLIGWSRAQREANLCYVANNQRFLILPWVRVKNLASYLLSAS